MTKSKAGILAPGANAYTLREDSVPFATLVGRGIQGSDAVKVLTGHAPTLSVTVKDTVPLSMARTLSGNMLIATYGRGPVSIEISGLDVYDADCYEKASSSNAKDRIQDFWAANNVHDNPSARLTLCLGTDKKQLYTCVLVGLMTANVNATAAQLGYTGLGTYRLELVGCPTNS